MMTFNDYVSALDDIEKEEKLLHRRIDYRVIQLLGKRVSTGFMDPAIHTSPSLLFYNMWQNQISDEEKAILENDLALIGLYDQLRRLKERKRIVEDRAVDMNDVYAAADENIAYNNLVSAESDTYHCKED